MGKYYLGTGTNQYNFQVVDSTGVINDLNLSGLYLSITGKAADADKLDNFDSSFFRNAQNLTGIYTGQISGSIGNADTLDGLDSSYFLNGANITGTVSLSGTFTGYYTGAFSGTITHTDYIQFHTGLGINPDPAELTWDDNVGTMQLGLDANVDLRVGFQNYEFVTNRNASTLSKGSVVYISGAQGNRPAVALALANADSTSAVTFGILAEDIPSMADGYAITNGLLTNLNTTGFAEGAALYLSPTVSGAIISSKPQAPNHGVLVGFCVRSHQSAGEILVKIQNGPELDELHDVRIISAQNNDIIRYNAPSGVWFNSNTLALNGTGSHYISGDLGIGTPSPSAKLHIFGADKRQIITSTTDNAALVLGQWDGTTNRIESSTRKLLLTSYASGISLGVNGSENVHVSTSGNLGVGTLTPAQKLTIGNGGKIAVYTAGDGRRGLFFNDGTGTWLESDSSGSDPLLLSSPGTNGSIRLYTNGTEKARLDNNGNFGIGSTGPNSKLTIGTDFASIAGITVDTAGGTDSQLVLRKAASKPAFGVLTWDNEVYLSAGIYYDGGTWVHHNSNNSNQLFVMRPGTGVAWYASNNGTGSWDAGSNVILWDHSGYWKNLVQSTASGSSYFTGGNVGVGTASPSNKLDVAVSAASSTFLTDANVYAFAIKNTDTTAGNAVAMTFGHGGSTYTNFIASVRTGVGSIPTGDLVFGGRPADNTNFVERVRIVGTTGNVGIGSTSPNQKLEIKGGNVRIDNRAAGSYSAPDLEFLSGDSSGSWNAFKIRYTKNATLDRLEFIDGGNSNAFVIANAGSVGFAGTLYAGTTLSADSFPRAYASSGSWVFHNQNNTFNPHIFNLYGAGGLAIGYVSGVNANKYVRLYSAKSDNNSGVVVSGGSDGSGAGLDVTGYDFGGTAAGGYARLYAHNNGAGTGNNIYLATGGSDRLTIDKNGNVGIGTTSPLTILNLSGGGGAVYQTFTDTTNAYHHGYIGKNGGGLVFGFSSQNGSFSADEKMRITTSGNVGIGTTTPLSKLHIAGTHADESADRAAATVLTLDTRTDGTGTGKTYFKTGWINTGNYGVSTIGVGYWTGSNAIRDVLTLLGNGNVGIGTSTPATKLDVAGVGRFGSAAERVSIGHYLDAFSGNYSTIQTNSHGDFTFASNLVIRADHDLTTTNSHGSMQGAAIVLGGNGYTLGANSIAFFAQPDTTATAGTVVGTSAARMVIRNNGNIAIGATVPNEKLDVRGYIVSNANNLASEGGFYLGNNGHGIRRAATTNDVYVYTTSGSLYLGTSGTNTQHVTINSSGNVIATGNITSSTSTNATQTIQVTNSNAANSALSRLVVSNGTYEGSITVYGTGFTTNNAAHQNRMTIAAPFICHNVSGQHYWWIGTTGAGNDPTNANQVMILTTGGQFITMPPSYSYSAWGLDGINTSFRGRTVTDSSTAASGTAASAVMHSFGASALAATNTSVTTTNAATVYIAGGPSAGTNQTITNSWGLWNAGKTRLDSDLFFNTDVKIYRSGANKLATNATGIDLDSNITIQGGGNITINAGSSGQLFLGTNGTTNAITINTSQNATFAGFVGWANGIAYPGGLGANGQARIYSSSTYGLVLYGQGSTSDILLMNRSGSSVITVPANTINVEFAGNVLVAGNLTINGTTTTVNSTTITVDDPIFTLGGDTSVAETTKDRGIEFKWNGTTLTITNYIGNGTTTVTGTVASTSGYAAGDIITISGATGTEESKLNGTWKIASVPNASTFTFVVSSSVASATYTANLGTTVKSKNGFFGLDQSTGRFTFIPQADNSSEVFSGTLGSIEVGGIVTTGIVSSGPLSITHNSVTQEAITISNAAAGGKVWVLGPKTGNAGFGIRNSTDAFQALSIAETSTGTTTIASTTSIGSLARTNGTNVTALTLADNLTGTSTVGFGLQIRGTSNGGNAISAIGFENGGTGTNNESQIGFYTQNVAGGLTRQFTIGSTGNGTLVGNFTVSGGTITGGTTGLSLAAGGTNQNITLTPSGTGRVDIVGTANAVIARIGAASQYLTVGSYTPNSAGATLGYNGTQYLGLNAFFGVLVGRTYVSNNTTAPADGMIVQGSVGIGTTSPQTPLHAYASTTDSTTGGRTTALNVLTLESENTAALEYTGFGQGLVFRGSTYNNATQRTLGRIVHKINDDSVNTTRGTSIHFETSDNATNTNAPTEKMVINYAGNVGIANTTPSEALEVGTNSAGKNVKINSTLGSELIPALTAGNWTGTNWSATGTTITHTTGTTGSISPTSALSISAGKVYKVVMTLSTGGGLYHSFSLGGKNYTIASTTSAQIWYVYTTSTANFTISNLSNGDSTITITAISIKEVLATTGTLSVEGPVTFNSTLGINNLGIGTPSSWTINAPLEVIDYGSNAIRVTRQGAATQYLAIHTGNGGQFTIAAIANGNDKPFVISTDAVNQGIQIHTGSSRRIEVLGSGKIVTSPSAYSLASWTTTGSLFEFGSATVTNSSTAASGTAASAVFYSFAAPTLAATNASVTTTAAATVYIAGDVAAGTNQTITNSYGLWNVGKTRLDGNVGINTATPSANLDITGNARVSTYYNFNGNPSNPANTTAALYDQSGVGPTLSGLNVTFRAGSTTPAEVMRIASGGNVGIGTTSPGSGSLLDVAGAKNTSPIYITQTPPTVANVFGDYVGLDFRMYNEIYPSLQFTGNPAARISAYLEAGSNIFGLDFWTRPGAGTFSKAMRITGGGVVGIGTSTPSALYRLTINGVGTASEPLGGIVLRQGGNDVFYIGNIQRDNSTDFELWNPRNGYLRIATNNVERLNISASGKFKFTPSNYSLASWTTTGSLTEFVGATVTNSSTAQSTTAASAVFHSFAVPTLAATNTSVTTTAAATVYIAGDVTAGTNQTITNSYGLWNAGKTRLDGNVGIGIAGPYSSLSVKAQAVSWGEGILVDPASNGFSAIYFRTEANQNSSFTGTWALGKNSSAQTGGEILHVVKNGLTGGALHRVDAAQSWKTTGETCFGFNVGIGFTTPDQPLAFADSVAMKIQLNGSNANGYQLGLAAAVNSGDAMMKFIAGETGAGEFGFYTTTNLRLLINKDGNVGIGTTSPSVKFHVVGSSILASNTSINPFSYTNTIVAGAISDGQWGVSSAIGGCGSTGHGWAIGTNNSRLYLAYGNGATVNTLQSYIEVDTSRNMYLVPISGNVGIGTSTAPAYKLEVNGSFAATTKSFVIKHPTKEGKKLRYGSLEGPENGVYVRGKTTSKVIELPDYWTKLVDPDSITVQLTPIGSHQKLYVEKIEDNKVYIANENLLAKSINCFFYILAERADVEKLQVEIDA